MDNIISMTIIQCTPDLPRKLSRRYLAQPPMADNVVQHLFAVEVFENHIIVVRMNNHFSHAAYIRMMQTHGECRLAERAKFLAGILRCWFSSCVRTRMMNVVGCVGYNCAVDPTKNLDGKLFATVSSSTRRTLEQTNLLSCDIMSSQLHFPHIATSAQSLAECVIADYPISCAAWYAGQWLLMVTFTKVTLHLVMRIGWH